MPNWCYSTVKVHGVDEQLVKKVHCALDEAMDGSAVWWWEEILQNIGIDVADTVSTRGSITFISDCAKSTENPYEYVFSFDTEDAWAPLVDEIMPLILDKLEIPAGEIKYCYVAAETGMDLYMNTDKTRLWFPEDYYIEGDITTKCDSYCGKGFLSHEKLVGIINRIFHKDCHTSIEKEELMKIINKEMDNVDMTQYYFIVGILQGE